MYRTVLLPFLIVFLCFPLVRTSISSNKFNITLTTPQDTNVTDVVPHRSVHVKFTVTNQRDRWIIVGFEPIIQVHQKIIQQLTVSLCDSTLDKSIWYDDQTPCYNGQSMLIYEWTPHSSSTPFFFAEDHGLLLNSPQSIILTLIYRREKRTHREKSGIILHITTKLIKFPVGTLLVGNRGVSTSFSCRSTENPRRFYAIKELLSNELKSSWRAYIIRVRLFGRKLIEPVFDSSMRVHQNQTNIEIVPSDLFFISGDYLLVECDNSSHHHCDFLVYYTYKSKSIKHDCHCNRNEHPKLFKLIPIEDKSNQILTQGFFSNITGSTILLIICLLFIVIWVTIIIVCVILRRVHGLVNYHTESSLPGRSQKTKFNYRRTRNGTDNFHQKMGDADHIVQQDVENAAPFS